MCTTGPRQARSKSRRRLPGYIVSNNLTVRIRDLASVGTILDESVTLGVNNGGGIRFGNDDPKDEIAKARSLAMKDAMERASTLLEAAGARMGPLLEINEGFSQPSPVSIGRERMMASDQMAAVPVEGGENTYRVNVTVTWQIDQ